MENESAYYDVVVQLLNYYSPNTSRPIRLVFTHTHTHTHTYIYIYIYIGGVYQPLRMSTIVFGVNFYQSSTDLLPYGDLIDLLRF